MTVELTPNCNHAPSMGVSNSTFFTMVNSSGMANIIGRQTTNDPISVSSDDAIKCRDLLKSWEPPGDWGSGLKAGAMKDYFIEFFRRCDGFTTR